MHSLKLGPIHEAFITNEAGHVILESIPIQPPDPIQENTPPQQDPQTIWISGYWSWSKEHNDFIWIGGVWRVPPPGMDWIKGEWKQFEEGWAYLSGFWSKIPSHALSYTHVVPPAPIDEKTPPAPGSDYFWLPGYWFWNEKGQKYGWFSGKWEKFDPNWVYVPAHYIWRQQGYTFINGYWDLPIEKRGTAFASMTVSPMDRKSVTYTPQTRVDPLKIVEFFFPQWPDYSLFYNFHHFFNQEVWKAWRIAPPWWGWNNWWTFTRQDQWSVWWWWTHPGYVHPSWLNSTTAEAIQPPSELVLKIMETFSRPPIVTLEGVIARETLLRGLQKVTGLPDGPILPSDPREINDIQDVAKPITGPNLPYLKPLGKEMNGSAPEKPFFGPSLNTLPTPPDRVRIPVKPVNPPPGRASPVLPFQKEPQERPAFPKISKVSIKKKKIPTYKPPQQTQHLLQDSPNPPSRKNPSSTVPSGPSYRDSNPFSNRYSPVLSPSDRYPITLPQRYTEGVLAPSGPNTRLAYPPQTHRPNPYPSNSNQMLQYPLSPSYMNYSPVLPPRHTSLTMPPNQPYIQGYGPVDTLPYKPLMQQDRGGFMQNPMPQQNIWGPSVNDPTGHYERYFRYRFN